MRVLILIVATFFLAGCSNIQRTVSDMAYGLVGGQDNADPPAELVPIEPEVTVRTLWDRNVGSGYDDQLVKLVPAVAEGRVFAADREGLVEAFDAKTGKRIWEVETDMPIAGGPGLGFKSVLVGTSNARVIALSQADGSTLWTAKVSSEVLSIPKAEQGIVVVRTIDGRITALSEDTGSELWVFERNIPALTLRGTGSPVIVGDLVVDGYDNGKLVGLRLGDGRQMWETSIAIPRGRTELERLVDIDADPVIVDDIAYVAGFQSGISAVTLRDGDVLWRREEMSSFAGLSADWRYLYMTDDESHVWELDQRNGAALWKQSELARRRLTAPVAYGDHIVAGDFEGYLHWLSQDDGRQLGRIKIAGGAIVAPPVVVDGIVYVYASDGTLAALTLE